MFALGAAGAVGSVCGVSSSAGKRDATGTEGFAVAIVFMSSVGEFGALAVMETEPKRELVVAVDRAGDSSGSDLAGGVVVASTAEMGVADVESISESGSCATSLIVGLSPVSVVLTGSLVMFDVGRILSSPLVVMTVLTPEFLDVAEE